MYILENPDGRFYIGQTDELDRRRDGHKDSTNAKSKYTAKNGQWKLVWSENHQTRYSAMNRERFIKSRKAAAWKR